MTFSLSLSLSLMSFLLHVHTYSHHLSSQLFTYLPNQPSTISHQRPQFFVYCVTIFSCTNLLIPLYVKSSCPRISVTRFGDLLDFGKLLKPLAIINLPKSPTVFGNFCVGAKIFHFSSEILFGQLLWTFGDFSLVTLIVT